jgi:hypothetical protein
MTTPRQAEASDGRGVVAATDAAAKVQLGPGVKVPKRLRVGVPENAFAIAAG